MAFSIDKNLTMKIRKGTTGEFLIEDLPSIFNSCIARLVIKKDENSKDFDAPVNKTVTIADGKIDFKLTVEDTDALTVDKDEDTGCYKWGILIEDGTGELAVNLIPEQFDIMPDCIVYPEIAGGN